VSRAQEFSSDTNVTIYIDNLHRIVALSAVQNSVHSSLPDMRLHQLASSENVQSRFAFH
jgi:hypothetical protein